MNIFTELYLTLTYETKLYGNWKAIVVKERKNTCEYFDS
jgi:hypothetical protein